MAKVTTRDIDDLETKMIQANRLIFQEKNAKLNATFKKDISAIREGVEEIKTSQSELINCLDHQIVGKMEEANAKKREIYFRGATFEKIKGIITNMIEEEHTIRVHRVFKKVKWLKRVESLVLQRNRPKSISYESPTHDRRFFQKYINQDNSPQMTSSSKEGIARRNGTKRNTTRCKALGHSLW